MVFAFSMPLTNEMKLNYNDEYDRILEPVRNSNLAIKI